MSEWSEYISSDPKILFGKPVITGTRISVDLILEKMSVGDSVEDLLEAYPNLSKEKILACFKYASESIKNEVIFSKAS